MWQWQADELRALAGLARDAGEILFEMAAMHDDSEAAQDMLEKSQQLEVRTQGSCFALDTLPVVFAANSPFAVWEIANGIETSGTIQIPYGCVTGTTAGHDRGFQGRRRDGGSAGPRSL